LHYPGIQSKSAGASRSKGSLLRGSLFGLWLWACGCSAWADDIALNPNHPNRYTVEPGDTLWDIASRFLANPWQWSEIWQNNPHIRNPHLIYPGDVLVLSYVNGQPRLALESPSEIRLSPKIHESPITEAIPAIPMNAIRQFLTRPKVLSEDELADAPYVVAFSDRRIVGGAGDQIYVRAIEDGTRDGFTVFRKGTVYKDMETDEVLGYEALYIGDTRLVRTGDPATLQLTLTEREVQIGDRLLPVESEHLRLVFQPHAPNRPIQGHIMSVLAGVTQIGQYSVLAIDRGAQDGVEVGHVLAILQKGAPIRDIVSWNMGELVEHPAEKAGLMMIFRTFERISYGLVMHASHPLHISDIVQNP
jgi:hypothetical protein